MTARVFPLLLALGCTGELVPDPQETGIPADDPATTTPIDTGEPVDTDTAPPVGSRCTESPDRVVCSHRTLTLDTGLLTRQVHYEIPLGDPPPEGWPTVVFFQGSFYPSELAFSGEPGAVHGQFFLAKTVKALLDAGYVVLAPEALLAGATAWETNIPPMMFFWEGCEDDQLMDALFEAMADGRFAPVDDGRLYATGISSGGFMTSRMAVSYAGRFRALAVHSGSYATCSALCVVPRNLPSDHPPTLFLHGGDDHIVPPSSMEPYRDALEAGGVDVRTVFDDTAAHEWLPSAVTEVPDWFDSHR